MLEFEQLEKLVATLSLRSLDNWCALRKRIVGCRSGIEALGVRGGGCSGIGLSVITANRLGYVLEAILSQQLHQIALDQMNLIRAAVRKR